MRVNNDHVRHVLITGCAAYSSSLHVDPKKESDEQLASGDCQPFLLLDFEMHTSMACSVLNLAYPPVLFLGVSSYIVVPQEHHSLRA